MSVVEGGPASAVLQPRQLIVSLYGLYARQHDDWISVAAVVRLMAELGVDEQAVRSSISRLRRRGLLDAARVDGAAGYRLTPLALEILAEGDARIFGRRRATSADGWLLVIFSVPESERDKRHQLRSLLTRMGFGTVAPGVWVAPGHLEEETGDALRRIGLDGYAEVFSGQHVLFGDARENVGRWWDLRAFHELYAAFIQRYDPLRQRLTSGSADRARIDPGAAFAAYVEMVTSWRQLPYADPGLPLELLPPDWNGAAAEQLFTDLRGLIAGPAAEHVSGTLAPRGVARGGGDTTRRG